MESIAFGTCGGLAAHTMRAPDIDGQVTAMRAELKSASIKTSNVCLIMDWVTLTVIACACSPKTYLIT
ncbi:hypothetical protein [Nitrosomonas aestuarii]|uniref:hypothetical protein n=1 Tax=Nitrosomonas aestuarii TaxID=52441 RepID=UPI000B848752|nr:hypothetical protein [Nitrosomonas aestuarii]